MPAPKISSGRVQHGDQTFWQDGRGALLPVALVKPTDVLRDELVRELIGEALPLAASVGAFRASSLERVDAYVKLLEQEYQAKAGGSKGNMTLVSFDHTLKVEIQVAERIQFGPELQVAKGIVDECMMEWSAGGNANLQAIVMRAFDVDKQGKVNSHNLLSLLRLNIEDERWKRAMDAVTASMQTEGSKRYIRFYVRANAEAEWIPVSINVATA